ncbi:MAG: hypothetical protein K6F63_05795 [Lachnospiraceae bacterium]|nr:hypothetical protein [Lachnospiraceae bacterium]
MKKYIGGIIGGVVILGIVIWIVFYTVNNRKSDSIFETKTTSNTEAQAIISKDLDRFYPSTVREVVRLYQRINTCLMSGNYTEAEFYKITEQLRRLYDDELLELNPKDSYEDSLYNEIIAFRNEGKVISVTNVQLESQTEKYTKDGKNMASIVGMFVVRDKTGISRTYEKFVLREDEKGNWKILGWELTDPVEFPD